MNAALAEISVIHNKIFLESFWADLDEVMKLKDCEVKLRRFCERVTETQGWGVTILSRLVLLRFDVVIMLTV